MKAMPGGVLTPRGSTHRASSLLLGITLIRVALLLCSLLLPSFLFFGLLVLFDKHKDEHPRDPDDAPKDTAARRGSRELVPLQSRQ